MIEISIESLKQNCNNYFDAKNNTTEDYSFQYLSSADLYSNNNKVGLFENLKSYLTSFFGVLHEILQFHLSKI